MGYSRGHRREVGIIEYDTENMNDRLNGKIAEVISFNDELHCFVEEEYTEDVDNGRMLREYNKTEIIDKVITFLRELLDGDVCPICGKELNN